MRMANKLIKTRRLPFIDFSIKVNLGRPEWKGSRTSAFMRRVAIADIGYRSPREFIAITREAL